MQFFQHESWIRILRPWVFLSALAKDWTHITNSAHYSKSAQANKTTTTPPHLMLTIKIHNINIIPAIGYKGGAWYKLMRRKSPLKTGLQREVPKSLHTQGQAHTWSMWDIRIGTEWLRDKWVTLFDFSIRNVTFSTQYLPFVLHNRAPNLPQNSIVVIFDPMYQKFWLDRPRHNSA